MASQINGVVAFRKTTWIRGRCGGVGWRSRVRAAVKSGVDSMADGHIILLVMDNLALRDKAALVMNSEIS